MNIIFYFSFNFYNFSGELLLPPGVHHFTFEMFLPQNLPTSMEGDYGHIRYSVKIVMDIPMWIDKEFEFPFTVIKYMNLNIVPEWRVSFPVFAEYELLFYCFIFNRNRFKSVVRNNSIRTASVVVSHRIL